MLTICRTPSAVDTEVKCGGTYKYLGIELGIKKYVNHKAITDNVIKLIFNIDGVPLFKSSNTQAWPILCQINKGQIFVVALYTGENKPTPVQEYLADFIDELKNLLSQGIVISHQVYALSLVAFLCDAPACSFLKHTIGHTGYWSCERCLVKGSWSGRVVFNGEEQHGLRTDNDFAQMLYQNHQKGLSPLLQLKVRCVSMFPLDYMHLVCLGAVRRIIQFWKKGSHCRMSQNQLLQISDKLIEFREYIPSDFVRKPRSLRQLDYWKATEFWQFLLYTGPVALYGILPTPMYQHFLSLSMALNILLSECEVKRAELIDYAQSLLQYFVHSYFYALSFTVYNIHGLIHLSEDVRQFGCSLNKISCFPFESYLQIVKKAVKNATNPTAQIIKRLQLHEAKINESFIHTKISNRQRDRCFIIKGRLIAYVTSVIDNNNFECETVKLDKLDSFFDVPFESTVIDIYFVSRNQVFTKRILIQEDLVKCVCLPFKNGHVVFPLVHFI